MTTLITLNVTLSLMFIMMTHPLSMGMMLLAQTLVIAMMTKNFTYNSWFSYIMFLILIGGMLILFMYMTSIASNEKFSINMKMMSIPIITMTTTLIPSMYLNISTINNEMKMMNMNMTINTSMIKYINFPANLILLFMIMYLFLALVATVKITNIKNGPIRQMN
uniref:NADH-ubiquinone oxidoreductase chain 6 n=1 Tax=Asbolus verrucosus TaxID=1661398 RepID=A0A0U2C4M0_ASBVE|nr:NADH dehydrogenase subunit 6 [Asbolus verrucosus]AKJ52251.1 NADH dehydrogenase subunit 6 [Asbolus verrucosus]